MDSIFLLISMFTGLTDAGVRPVVTFTPIWNKILSGDSVTMTCNVDGAVQGNVTYTWYRNNQWINNWKTFPIQSAQPRHGGKYQCGSSEDDLSEAVMLNVTKGPVILQSPPFVYEGDDLELRCHSGPKDPQGPTAFYRDNEKLPSFANDSEILLRAVMVTAVYKCTRQVRATSIYSDEADVRVQELFSSPEINLTQGVMVEGHGLTLTCATRLSPHRLSTTLQFAFYRDGHEVQGFGPSDNYDVSPSRLEDSGNYSCATRTLNGRVRKTSQDVNVQIYEMERHGLNKYLYPTVIVILLIISAFLIFRHKHQILQTRDHQPVHSSGITAAGEYETIYSNIETCRIQTDVTGDDDVCYASLNLSPKGSSPKVANTSPQVLYSAVKIKYDVS